MYRIIDEFSTPPHIAESKRLFVLLVGIIRPGNGETKAHSEEKLLRFIEELKADEKGRQNFLLHLKCIFSHYYIGNLLMRSGVPKTASITSEFFSRLGHQILPPIKEEDDFSELMDDLFSKKNDYRWVEAISTETWEKLFSLIDFSEIIDLENIQERLVKTMLILSYKISAQGLDESFLHEHHSGTAIITPFAEQNKECVNLSEAYFSKANKNISTQSHSLIQKLNECSELIRQKIRMQYRHGAGIEYTILLNRLDIQVNRLKIFATLVDPTQKIEIEEAVQLFKAIVYYENTGDSFISFLNDNINTISYRIAIHKSETGEHYITNTRKEYFTFFKSACGGGFFAGFMAILKLIIHHLHLPVFQQHFLYSLNYASGFVGIQLTHSTLATKQPAMTASALAGELDKSKNHKEKLGEIKVIIAKVWRSQFIAFAGNLLVTFPFAYLLAFVYHMVTGHKIAEGAEAQTLLDEQNYNRYPVIIYASFTGVFLFLSGIISGFFDNNVQFKKIPERIARHPFLLRVLGKKTTQKLSAYSRHNLGGLAGNVFLGFFLGFAGFFGKIFGLPFDIRHITISTGHFAIGTYGLDNEIYWSDWVNTILGVILIGFMNFSVSFGLAFYVALRARRVKLPDYKMIITTTLQYFLKHPLDFFYPPKNERKI